MEKRLAKIINYGIALTKSGDPCVVVNFKTKKAENEYVDMMWQGSLKEGRAREITIDALIAMGLKDADLTCLALNTGLDKNKELEVTIEPEEYNGKFYDKIKWVNEPYKGREMLQPGDAVQKLMGLNLKGDVMARMANKGVKQQNNTDDIPF